MRLPELFYQPTEKGLQALAPGRFARTSTQVTAAANITVDLASPTKDDVIIITHVHLFLDPGAGQNVTNLAILIIDEAGNAVGHIDVAGLGAADLQISRTLSTEFVVLPGEVVRCTVNFNSGAAGNQVTFSLMGYRINRGNWQFG